MSSKILKTLVYLSAAFTFGILGYIILYILANGVQYLTPELFELNYSTQNVSMMPALISTLYLVFGGLLISTPIGVFTGFYLVDYANRKNPVVKAIGIATDTLSGVPSIVYGLFGMLLFVTPAGFGLGIGYSMLSGILTISIMILPVIIRSTEEALIATGMPIRQASYALGAGKLRTLFTVVLPVAMPGILGGVILAIGRIVGETAALMFTLGTATNLPQSIFTSARTLSLHMYMLSTEGQHVGQAYATAVVLLLLVLILNGLSTLVSRRLSKGGK